MKIQILLLFCTHISMVQAQERGKYHIQLKSLSDAEYPDNPDISLRDKGFTSYDFDKLILKKCKGTSVDLTIFSDTHSDTFVISDLDLQPFIPSIPKVLKGDHYLEILAITNQEWNRHQVSLSQQYFTANHPGSKIVRIDIARNCLQSGLWEIFMFREAVDGLVPVHHSWFDFPMPLYEQLFQKINRRPISGFSQHMNEWKTPDSKMIEFSKLRQVITSKELIFNNFNQTSYPLQGEQKKKYQNIIYPKETTVMKDFLTDDALFATFTPPGYYNTKDPRVTELGKLYQPVKVLLRTVTGHGKGLLSEVEIQYMDKQGKKMTKLFISGLDFSSLPHLSAENVGQAWKSSMGFGNHTFYETLEAAKEYSCKESLYFCILTDSNDKWLDSHAVGIDGPVLHWDDQIPNLMHLWLLSFERHCFVGHLSFKVE